MEKAGINKKRRKYDESFKVELLKMVKSGRSVAEVSRTMGIGKIFYTNGVQKKIVKKSQRI